METTSGDYLGKRIEGIFEEFLKTKKLLEAPFDKNKIKRLTTSIDRLQITLEDLNPIETSWLGKREVIDDEKNNPLKWLSEDYIEDLKIIEIWLTNIKSRADRAFEFFSDNKGGRPKDLALKYFIIQMAALWKEVKGKKPSKTYPTDSGCKNDFLDWVYESLENIGHKPQSKESLAKYIQRTLF